MDELWKTIWTVAWWQANIGQIFGAVFGAIAAYLIGAYQTRKQILLSQLPERMKHAKLEMPFLHELEVALERIGLQLERPNEFEPNFLTKKLDPLKERWWDLLSNPRLSEKLDRFVGKLGDTENVIELMDDRNEESILYYKRMSSESHEKIDEIWAMLIASESSSRKLLGLKPLYYQSPWEKARNWFRFSYRRLRARIFKEIPF